MPSLESVRSPDKRVWMKTAGKENTIRSHLNYLPQTLDYWKIKHHNLYESYAVFVVISPHKEAILFCGGIASGLIVTNISMGYSSWRQLTLAVKSPREFTFLFE